MFTGIIETIAKVVRRHEARLYLELNQWPTLPIHCGDSIAINGTCLTVVESKQPNLAFDLSAETLRCTNLGGLKPQQLVNIEFAMLLTTRLSGHIVSGHIDGIARVSKLETSGNCWKMAFNVPEQLQKYIVNKGSVCVDGVSLTVNEVAGNEFSVTLIPHTWQNTISQFYHVGAQVNLEVDLIARYVAGLLTENRL